MNEKINVTIAEQQGLNVGLSNTTIGTGTGTNDYNDLTNKPRINGQILQGEMTIVGEKGEKGDKGEQGIQGIQGVQGERGERGVDGINGKDGVDGTSPTITVATSTDTEYTLSITDVNGTITTPNLKGADGTSSSTGGGGTTTTYRELIVDDSMTKKNNYANYIAITGNKVEIFFNLSCDVVSMQTPKLFQIPQDIAPNYSHTQECLCILGYSDANGVYSGILQIFKDNAYYDGYAVCFCKYGTKEIQGYLTYTTGNIF